MGEVAPLLRPGGVLIVDDTTYDKPIARKIDLVSSHRFGKHKALARGISLVTAVGANRGSVLPVDHRVHRPDSGAGKNDHFREHVAAAHGRGLAPRCVLLDSRCASLDNFRLVGGRSGRS